MSKSNHKLKEKFVGATIGRPHFGGIAKKENGITLIALIITIIVMLVLTGVTLTVTLGENGLIAKANEAKLQMQIETDKEELLSAVVGAIGIDGKVDFTYLDSHLSAGFTGNNGTYTSSNGHTFTVSENGDVQYITEVGEQSNIDFIKGKYYPNPTNENEYYEIDIDNNVVYYGYLEDDLKVGYNISGIDEENLIISANMQDPDTEETYNVQFNCELIIENKEIINVLLFGITEETDGKVFLAAKNMDGLQPILTGEYYSQSGQNLRLVFDDELPLIEQQYNSNGNWQPYSFSATLYVYWDGKYYCSVSATSEHLEVSEDMKTIILWGISYVKN